MFYFHNLLLNLKFMLDKIHPIFLIQSQDKFALIIIISYSFHMTRHLTNIINNSLDCSNITS